MYCYIYDEFVSDKRFEKDLLLVENRLTDLGIAGKIVRLALFRDPQEMVRDEIRRGIKNIIVVGNDLTTRKVIDLVADTAVTFGMIPMGEETTLAKIFGVPAGVAACDVLSARIIETIDMGHINTRRFMGGVHAENFIGSVACAGGSFRLTPERAAVLDIFNLALAPDRETAPDPRDGLLDLTLTVPVKSGWGIFKRSKMGVTRWKDKQFVIEGETELMVDGEILKGNRFEIGIVPGVLKVITGKGRVF
ncbi:hypothetical protein HYV73_00825 [Candidatus Uhrbacteria bacterium]|nr:hypothetical protein [Candidatus Uhrbacteria bacterium]